MTKEEFLKDIEQDEFGSHRRLLWSALELTKHTGLPVIELGCGHGSTPFLQQYCKDNGLELFSYDYNKTWADKFGATHISDWSTIPWRKEYSVALVDESPGEHRKISVQNFVDNVKIVVIHDSEPPGWNTSDYQVREEFYRYIYSLDEKATRYGAPWTSMLSNFIPLVP